MTTVGMHVHFIAVAGTGMGSLAGLFRAAGHEVSGSDVAFYPPMGPALARWGIRTQEGFSPANLEPRPDLVVVGNVCRRDNPEVVAARSLGLPLTHMCEALGAHITPHTSPLVVGGTHGKTTTSALATWMLEGAERAPGFLIGGIPRNFDRSHRLAAGGRPRLPRAGEGGRRVPFVIEGDEYDTAFFEKTPKFWHYRPEVAVITSIEHDHVDIYPDEASYHAAFTGFIERVPADGLIVAHAGDAAVVSLVQAHARAEVAWFGVDGEPTYGGAPPHWLLAPGPRDATGQSFDLYVAGTDALRGVLPMSGRHNLRNAAAALGAVCQGYGVGPRVALRALASFQGIARRQELRGVVRGVQVYDDFAHHPTAVAETLAGLRRMHPDGRLWAVYEPRTATACRDLHQERYLLAFDAADRIVFAPLGRTGIADDEVLDLSALARGLEARGRTVALARDLEDILAMVVAEAEAGDTVAVLSNGAFGGIHERLLAALATPRPAATSSPAAEGARSSRTAPDDG